MNYYLLTGGKYKDFLIREDLETRKEWYFNFDKANWEPISVMVLYTWYESPEFELYETLTEAEALALVKKRLDK